MMVQSLLDWMLAALGVTLSLTLSSTVAIYFWYRLRGGLPASPEPAAVAMVSLEPAAPAPAAPPVASVPVGLARKRLRLGGRPDGLGAGLAEL